VVNQDGSLNSASNPAVAGSVVSIYLTGLPTGEGDVTTVRLGGVDLPGTEYAGPAPTLTGVQQVNFGIPADQAPATTGVSICGMSLVDGQTVCSPAVAITVRR
jgi:uncharacterized protein (TIGR03437 family)